MEPTFMNTIRSKLGLAAVGKPALIGLTAIIVMVAVLAGHILYDTATATEIPIDREAEANVADETPDSGGETSKEGDVSLFAHVSGAVNDPGLVELPSGSRVADAVTAAGGFADDAVAESVNLARIVQDGEQIHVARTDEQVAAQKEGPAALAVTAAAGGKVNINTATSDELQSLPGIGPSIAQRIVASRESEGAFSTAEDIMRVTGIGEKKYESIAELICV